MRPTKPGSKILIGGRATLESIAMVIVRFSAAKGPLPPDEK